MYIKIQDEISMHQKSMLHNIFLKIFIFSLS